MSNEAIKVAADTAAQAIRTAQELKRRLDATAGTVKAASADLTKKVATVLVDCGASQSGDVDKIAAALADPETVLVTLAEIVQKSAAEIVRLKRLIAPGNPDHGVVIGPSTKVASAAAEDHDATLEAWNQSIKSAAQRMRS
jgi:hypothetical protein